MQQARVIATGGHDASCQPDTGSTSGLEAGSSHERQALHLNMPMTCRSPQYWITCRDEFGCHSELAQHLIGTCGYDMRLQHASGHSACLQPGTL
jgi:hypothetical protein